LIFIIIESIFVFIVIS